MEEYIYTPEEYAVILENKKDIENYISELYSNYATFIFSDKLIAVDVISDLKEVLFEYEKYEIVYKQKQQKDKPVKQYVVIEGDTLPRIAHKLTGDFHNWQTIYNYNGMTDLKLLPGNVIYIPEGL